MKNLWMRIRENYCSSPAIALGFIALASAVAMFINLASYVSIDNGWLLYAAEHYLKGESLYHDLLETNPPLVVWFYSLPVMLAQLLHVHATTAFAFTVLLVVLGSLAVSYGELKRNAELGAYETRNTIIMAVAAILLICSSMVFGQREHLWMALIMPYLLQSLGMRQRPPLSPRTVAIAMMAALGFMLKPFFVLVWFSNELFLTIQSKSPRMLFRSTNWIIGGAYAIYIAVIALAYPEYFSFILPYLAVSYDYYRMPWSNLLTTTALMSLFLLPPALLTREAKLRSISTQLVSIYIAVCMVHLAQQKGWYNHYYPMLCAGMLLASVTLIRQMGWFGMALTRARFTLFCITYSILVLIPVTEPMRLWDGKGANSSLETLQALIEKHAKGQMVTGYSFNLNATFPLMNYAPATYGSRFHHQWMVPAAADPRLGALALPLAEYAMKAAAEDLKKHLPALVWVDNNNSAPGFLEGFDFVAFFSQNPEFRAIWKSYKKIGVVNALPSGGNQTNATSYTVYILQ